jgi:Tol biopolymer transport system component
MSGISDSIVSDPSASALTGRHLGVYHLQALLGAGGMGEVYRARDTRLGRDIAIKILPQAFIADPDRLARFEREARVLASLNHPNIGAIYGLEEADGVRGLVLELVDGETLADRLRRGPVPVADALAFARQMADALDAAHERGIVHRDLKPANIKITPAGIVKVLDFGLAKASTGDGTTPDVTHSPTITVAGTRDGVILGTVAYMSPEQARGQAVDKHTDVWAFGCVLYEMLTGRPAFLGATASDTIAKILEHEPDWGALPKATPATVSRLIRRCVAKDSKHRLHDVADARIELDEITASIGVEASPAASASGGVSWRRRLFRERVAWALAGATLALAGLWALSPGGPSENVTAVQLSVYPPRGATFPFEGGAPWPSVSPDGRQLAFVAVTSGGQQQLWIRPLDSATAQPLQGTDGAARPFWSPDSRSIGFFANGRLWRFDLPGGPPQAITDAPYLGGMSATWGRDGVIVFSHVGGLHRVSAAGGPSTVAIRAPDEQSRGDFSSPAFLPDGRRFLYVVEKPPNKEETQVCVASLDSSDTKCVLTVHSQAAYAPPGYLLFVRDTVLRAQRFDASRLEISGEAFRVIDDQIRVEPVWRPRSFSVSDNGVLAFHPSIGETQLVWVNRSGTSLGAIGPTGDYGAPELSADHKRIIITRGDLATSNTDLWLYDLSRGTSSRFTFDPAQDSDALFSPGGERVVFFSTRNGSPGIWQKPTSGAGREEMLVAANGGPNDWSSDGRFVLYQSYDPRTGWDLWSVPLSGDRKSFPVVQTEHGERQGRFSPDVRWIAYDSTESGRREVWMQPFPPTGSKWQVSTGGGFSPRWRGDGNELYYVAADGKLTAVAVSGGSVPEFGTPTALFQTMFREGAYGSYVVSEDGQRFLMNVPPDAGNVTPITVVVNWEAALNR